MTELTWTIDPATGNLVVEGLTLEEASALAGDLLSRARELNCARPLDWTSPAVADAAGPTVRIARVYHASVVDGPGRRSVVQFQGCPIRCTGCALTETHSLTGGMSVPIRSVIHELLSATGEPRDGITVTGGEPFAQAGALLEVLTAMKDQHVHTTVYTGYTLEALAARSRPNIDAALELIDLLIDGPYVQALAKGAGEWRGSRNQRLIEHPAQSLAARKAA